MTAIVNRSIVLPHVGIFYAQMFVNCNCKPIKDTDYLESIFLVKNSGLMPYHPLTQLFDEDVNLRS